MAKKFLVPISAATVALISNQTQAAVYPTRQVSSGASASVPSEIKKPAIAARELHELNYLRGNEAHKLYMRKSERGLTFADHSSHGSHGSHGSHRSG